MNVNDGDVAAETGGSKVCCRKDNRLHIGAVPFKHPEVTMEGYTALKMIEAGRDV